MHISKRGFLGIGICCAIIVVSYMYYKEKNTTPPPVSPPESTYVQPEILKTSTTTNTYIK